MRPVHILNASSLPAEDLDRIARHVGDLLSCPIICTGGKSLNLLQTFDGSRRQYNSTALLAQLLSLDVPEGEKRIAVVDVDLFIPILTFVFGEAQLDGTSAVVSSHRLSNRFYGIEEDHVLLVHRLEKEIVHELCHTFGLYHCRQFECVMRSSTYVEEIDLKKLEPCPSCARVLAEKARGYHLSGAAVGSHPPS